MSEAAAGEVVAFESTVFVEAGGKLGTHSSGKPNGVEIGAGEVLPALERELIAMETGEARPAGTLQHPGSPSSEPARRPARLS